MNAQPPSGSAAPSGCVEDRPVDALMSRNLLAVTMDESVLVAWEVMERAGIHHLPVITPDGRCAGVVDAATIAAEWEAGPPAHARRPVSAYVRERRSPRVYRSDTVRVAARVMAANGLDAVPVVDQNGALVGLITARDLIAALAGMRPEELRAGVDRLLFPAYPTEPTAPQLPPD